MRKPVVTVVALVLLASAVAVASHGVTCDEPQLSLAFEPPRYIDTARAGGEPVSVVAQDGSITVSAHAGTTHLYRDREAVPGAGDFAVGYANQTLNWRSIDDGDTWTYTGTAGLPAGPHSATSTGFSDPDLAMDAGGRIYNVEIDLANVSVFSSVDDGQSFTFGNAISGVGDRPWLAAGDPDEVFLSINLPRLLLRSTTGGLAFDLVQEGHPVNGKILNDPLNFSSGLIGPSDGNGIAISDDDGRTWDVYEGSDLGPSTEFFGAIGVDVAGNAYRAAAGGYAGPSDTTPNGVVTFNSFDRSEKSWGTPIEIPTPNGDALWPWVIAGDDGRVAVTWLQSLAGAPDTFYVFAAVTTNALGSIVPCTDGSTRFIPPRFAVANASGRPVHVGAICQQGTLCNAVTNARNADRRLGDFLSVNFDHLGRVFVASGDTMLPNPLGGPKPVGNPIFIRQASGDRLLSAPRPTRAARCLFPLPVCQVAAAPAPFR